MDLIHPSDEAGVVDAMRAASSGGTCVLVVGGRRHMATAAAPEADAELWTTSLDRVIAYDPAEMLCVVESGMRLGDLRLLLADGGQEWPVDEPDDATVGGVIAADVALPRQLRVGCLRDTIVEMAFITGDGRRIRSGARTVKNVTGYDLHRLLTGSRGTLGVITQVALKVRPLPKVARTLVTREGGIDLASRLLDAVPLPAAVIAEHDRVVLRLEGWPEEVAEQASLANDVAVLADDDPSAWLEPAFPDAAIVAQAAVVPSKLADCVDRTSRYRALLGVGYAWLPCDDEATLVRLRHRVSSLGGIAPVIHGPGGLGAADPVTAAIGDRLKAAFDPAGVLAREHAWSS
ncbi:MAG TPA: FAD-binding protein [Actinomycetota bacterium]|nr:FAD-binding protein [Actinomycetota bacterium]